MILTRPMQRLPKNCAIGRKVFRLNIKRPNSNPGAARNHAAIHRERKSISLFWIESFQRIHDWLIFATSLRVAASYHRETFNCAIDSPKCHRVLQRVSPCPFYSGDAPCYAATRDLEQLGFHVLDAPGIQAVRLGRLVYVQGHFYQTVSEMRDDQMEAKTGTPVRNRSLAPAAAVLIATRKPMRSYLNQQPGKEPDVLPCELSYYAWFEPDTKIEFFLAGSPEKCT